MKGEISLPGEFFCCICRFHKHSNDERLTIIHGLMVCYYHVDEVDTPGRPFGDILNELWDRDP